MSVNQLPHHVHAVLSRPELAALWQQVRRQLERNSGKPRGSITVQVPDLPTASELGALLGRPLTRQIGRSTRVDLGKLDQQLSLTFNLNSIHIRLYVAYSLIDLIST